MNKSIVVIVSALFFFIPQFSFALTLDAPDIPSSLDYYGFLHTNYDASNNDLKDFLSYTNTGFAGSPEQVPIAVAAGFKHIVYIMNDFSPGYSPLLEKFVQNEHIQLNGVSIPDYDYRQVPDYKTKMLALYREQLTSLKNQLVANGTINKIDLFYVADEPALHRNYIPDQDFLNAIDQAFKSVFPGKKTIMAFAEDRSGTNPFRTTHMDPPPTLDAIGMDPYFDSNAAVNCTEESVRNYLYFTHPNSAISWATKWGKPVYLIGDAMLRNGKANPSCYVTNEFNIAKKDPMIKGLVWFIYDAGNLDGGTYLSGAAGNPEFVKIIKSLTAPTRAPIAPSPATPPTASAPSSSPSVTTNQLSQCIVFINNMIYGDNDYDSRGAPDGDVIKLQQYLHTQGFLKVSPTGYFGNATYLAVKAFQYVNGISGTGSVGPFTRNTLARATGCGTLDTTVPATPTTQVAAVSDDAVSAASPITNADVAAPTINITSNTSVTYGGKAVIAWNVVPANVTCTANGTGLAAGSRANAMGTWMTPELYDTSVYTMKCINVVSGQSAEKSITINVKNTQSKAPNAPSANPQAVFTQSKTSTNTNEPFSVTWSATNATSCTFETNSNNAGWVVEGAGLSATKMYSVATPGTYQGRLTCYGATGTTPFILTLPHMITSSTTNPSLPPTCLSEQTMVNGVCTSSAAQSIATSTFTNSTTATTVSLAVPIITLTPDTRVDYGKTATLAWTVTPSMGVSCVAAGGNLATGMTIGTTGSWTTPNLYTSTQYGIKCTNNSNGLSSFKYVTVTVPSQTSASDASASPLITVSGPTSSIAYGSTATITWGVTPALNVSCIAAGGNLAAGAAIGTTGSWITPNLYTNTQYGIKCTDTVSGLSSSNYVTVTVSPQATTDTCAALDPSQYCTTQSCTTNTGVVRYGTKDCSVDACAALNASQYCTTQSCTTNTGVVRYGTKVCSTSTMGGSTFASSGMQSSVLGVSTQCTDLSVNMHRGYESAAVMNLQKFLKSSGLLDEVTGFYGDKTVAAVKAYQKSRGLPMTGMVYSATRQTVKQDSCF